MLRFPNRLGARRTSRNGQAGQILVILVVAFIPILAMVGLIVDGGNAWSQQRLTQNGSDAAANAGAVVLAQRLGGTPKTDPEWDAAVKLAVDNNIAANGIQLAGAWYTDICGVLLTPAGTAAASTATAAAVGAGTLPSSSLATPDCTNNPGIVGPVAGVFARGEKVFPTYFARVVGITQYTATTEATAVTGYLQQTCAGNSGGDCILLPLAIYTNLLTCDNGGQAQDTGAAYADYKGWEHFVIPICHNAPGSVGWLDWTGGGGGSAELKDCIDRSGTADPCIPAITTPTWWRVAQAGNTNSQPIEDAINQYVGRVVLLPVFNLLCSADPPDLDLSQAAVPSLYGCPGPNTTDWNGDKGNPNWVHLQPFAAFLLEAAYTNGNNEAECTPNYSYPSSAGNCLIGEFVDYSVGSGGTVGPTPGAAGGVIGVQLIK